MVGRWVWVEEFDTGTAGQKAFYPQLDSGDMPVGWADKIFRALRKCPPGLREILRPILVALRRHRPDVQRCTAPALIPLIAQRSRCRANRHKAGGAFNFRKLEGMI